MNYKTCAVPSCTNTTIKTPEKLFVTVSKNIEVRKKWLQLARRDPREIRDKSVIFFCQDHFNMEQDMANYYQYNMGLSQRIIMKDGVVPTKFYCQEDHRKRMRDSSTSRPVLVKQQGTQLIEELQDSQMQDVLSEAGPSNTQLDPTAMQVVLMRADSESWGTESTELPVRVVSEPAGVSDPLAGAHTHHRCALCANTTNYFTDAIDRPYFHNNHTKLALNDLNIDIHLANTSKVCLDCDNKLLGILDFMKQVKDAQQLLNDETETVVKTECDSPTVDYEIDCKEGIVDSITIDPTVFVKHVKRKCDDDKPNTKRAKIPKDNEMPNDNKLMTDIKVERFEMDEVNTNIHEASEDTRREDTAPDIESNEFVIVSNALSNKTIGDGYN